jgi:site-specific DNA-cytosine methylase
LQALGLNFITIGCSDPKEHARAVTLENWSHKIKHFHKTLAEQLSNHACCLHPQSDGCDVIQDVSDIDVAMIGTSCRPFSRQRNKRFATGAVKAHEDHGLTFDDLVSWISTYEPVSLIAEQVEGFDKVESKSVTTTPFEQLCDILSKVPWKKGGYLIRLFHLDAKLWETMSRPRPPCCSEAVACVNLVVAL